MNESTKKRAQHVILEILRQAGGRLDKIRLNKAFYHAHLLFAENNAGFLSAWPFARMPRGPGIEAGGKLLEELLAAGALTQTGSGATAEYLLATDPFGEALPAPAQEAIRLAVEKVLAPTPTKPAITLTNNRAPGQRDATATSLMSTLIPFPKMNIVSGKTACASWIRNSAASSSKGDESIGESCRDCS